MGEWIYLKFMSTQHQMKWSTDYLTTLASKFLFFLFKRINLYLSPQSTLQLTNIV